MRRAIIVAVASMWACNTSTSGTLVVPPEAPAHASDGTMPGIPSGATNNAPSDGKKSGVDMTPAPTATTPVTPAPVAAGELTLVIIPPEGDLDWSSPGSLTRTAATATAAGKAHQVAGEITHSHAIGHVHVRMSCGSVKIETTGQTGGGSELQSGLDGMGALFVTYPGSLDETAAADADIEARKVSGRARFMSFKIRKDTCDHLRGFLDEYTRREAYKNYGSQFRPRRWEGAGCTAFSLAFVEIAGVLKRSSYTTNWARQVKVGLGRVSDTAGDGFYDYGSNLKVPGLTWPKGTKIHVSTWPISPLSSSLGDWNSSTRDVEWNEEPGILPDQIPLTLYDPQLMGEWVQHVHDAGGGSASGRTWTIRDEGLAPGLVTDAIDSVHLPWEDTNDDLNSD